MRSILVLIQIFSVTLAFAPAPFGGVSRKPGTFLQVAAGLSSAVDALKEVTDRITSSQGVFVYDSEAKKELEQAVADLEATQSPPSVDDYETLFQGDWLLVCTTATNSGGIDTSKLPFFNQDPLKRVRESLNSRVKVIQRIKSTTNDTFVDRVDHILEYEPPTSLESLFGEIPDVLRSFNLNPLELTKSKVTLIHKAEVESIEPKLITKLSLQSVVLNVAGKSQFLDPKGADVLGVNVPLGEFLNAGSFETTYMDDKVRISRGKLGGVIDQLRVFVKVPAALDEDKFVESLSKIRWEKEDETSMEAEVEWVEDDDETPSDVEQDVMP